MSATDRVVWGPQVGIGPNGTYEFPSDPGVYVFAEEGAAGVSVRYVGRAIDLRQRINDHLERSDNDCLKRVLDGAADVKIRATIQHDEAVRMNVEHTCYMRYLDSRHPLCNDAVPGGRDLGEIPLPF